MVVVVVVWAPHRHWLMVVVLFVGGCSWPFVVVLVQACRWCCWALDIGRPCCHQSSVAIGF